MEDISPGRVVGQDSIQTAIYQGKIYWFWGDTLFLKHPLGIFRMSGGTTPLVNPQQLQQTPELALKYDYFLDDKGYARNMMPHRDQPEGVIWIESIVVLNDVVFKDRAGSEIMLAHFSRRKGLTGVLEQGLAKFDDEKQEFVLMKTLALDEQWRYPHGHPLVVEHAGQRYFYFGSPHPNVRVKADLESVLDPGEYEALTCLNESGSVLFNSEAQPVWRWQKELKPVSSAMEYDWVQAGTLKVEDALFCPRDVDHPEDLIKLHRGTVHWNQYRQKYIMLAGQLEGKSSMLGEIWFSESAAPEGPFKQAKKVVTHNKQTFYNPCHHVFLDAGLGRTIYFEGTYTHDFSGNPHKTMRYNYNQILYKLDLSKLPL
jgi:hypothetical protein